MNAVNTTTAGPPFDYYYGTESKTFSFVRIPRIFFRDDRFRQLSSEAKLLYGLMLDRLSLSQKNGWLDDRGRVYIIYTIDQVREDLDCGRDKAMKTLDELDVLGGIGLIEKNRKGRGLPSLIYVKNFVKNSEPVHDIDRKEELAEVGKTEALKSENPTSGDLKNRLLKVGKPDCNNPENNQNNMSHTDHIHLSYGMAPVPVQEVILTDKTMDRMSKPPSGRITVKMPESYSAAACDVPAVSYPIKLQLKPGGKTVTASQSHSISCDHSISVAADSVSGASPPGAECSYRELVRRNINYDRLMRSETDRELYENFYDVMCDVLEGDSDAPITVNKTAMNPKIVKSRLLKINEDHMEYAVSCFKKTRSREEIRNPKNYMRTVLFNAPATMEAHIRKQVDHDMYAGCEKQTLRC